MLITQGGENLTRLARTEIDNIVEDYNRIRTKKIPGKVLAKDCKRLEELDAEETYTVCRIKPLTFRKGRKVCASS